MNKERYIELAEKYLSEDISKNEESELKEILDRNSELRSELEDQKKIKEVMKKMTLSNPKNELWDMYWLSIYNRVERGIAWLIISIGAIIVFGFAAYQAVSELLKETSTPPTLKFGLIALAIGFVVLAISLIREKIFSSKRDKYKEIQR